MLLSSFYRQSFLERVKREYSRAQASFAENPSPSSERSPDLRRL